jgi:hypothetical protein
LTASVSRQLDTHENDYDRILIITETHLHLVEDLQCGYSSSCLLCGFFDRIHSIYYSEQFRALGGFRIALRLFFPELRRCGFNGFCAGLEL